MEGAVEGNPYPGEKRSVVTHGRAKNQTFYDALMLIAPGKFV
jgi:hypothetical protein